MINDANIFINYKLERKNVTMIVELLPGDGLTILREMMFIMGYSKGKKIC